VTNRWKFPIAPYWKKDSKSSLRGIQKVAPFHFQIIGEAIVRSPTHSNFGKVDIRVYMTASVSRK
jgi:hypothetical protein